MLLHKEGIQLKKILGLILTGGWTPKEVSTFKILTLFYILTGSPGIWCRLNITDIYSGGTVLDLHSSECSSLFSGKFRNATFKEVMAISFKMLDYSSFSFVAAEPFHTIAFWVITSCNLVCGFAGKCCFYLLSQSTMKIEVLYSYETSITTN
jgi:hypothetical protein